MTIKHWEAGREADSTILNQNTNQTVFCAHKTNLYNLLKFTQGCLSHGFFFFFCWNANSEYTETTEKKHKWHK